MDLAIYQKEETFCMRNVYCLQRVISGHGQSAAVAWVEFDDLIAFYVFYTLNNLNISVLSHLQLVVAGVTLPGCTIVSTRANPDVSL